MLAFQLMEGIVWIIAATVVLMGALGVVLLRNPVHNALSLVATLFGVAVLFVAQEAYFLAAIQVIVYAGAIVVLFLFVIMLLGVDRFELLGFERQAWRRPVAVLSGVALAALVLVAVLVGTAEVTGEKSTTMALSGEGSDIHRLGRVLFTDYVWAFLITAVLLTIAVVGAVLLSRTPPGDPIDLDEFPPIEDDDEYDDELEEVDEGDEIDDEAGVDDTEGAVDEPVSTEVVS
jgi:NADH-quinone oxidoreductase subunit J